MMRIRVLRSLITRAIIHRTRGHASNVKMADKDIGLKVGQKFSSFEEVKVAIARYEETNYVNLYVNDSRSIVSALKRTPEKVFKPELKYFYLNYTCVAGGSRTFKSKSKGARPNQSTFRKGCPMQVKLRVSKDGNFLEVVVLNETHNHECDEVSFKHFPKQRRLNEETVNETNKLLKMKLERW
ncbi:uncharacterized protein LOC114541513 [Dendronephthya gigantea]|uniref:uncharacterized protein LOC114541513 n=1 Tax=Dendronephthya gigantea TaxID=151771 RepID=UPI00106D992A|nr:uncharacterized protein LOC114541513 [Dendronephthya gigantea]